MKYCLVPDSPVYKGDILLCLSDQNGKGANMNNRIMEYGWHQRFSFDLFAN